jgi:hypothetical protein
MIAIINKCKSDEERGECLLEHCASTSFGQKIEINDYSYSQTNHFVMLISAHRPRQSAELLTHSGFTFQKFFEFIQRCWR